MGSPSKCTKKWVFSTSYCDSFLVTSNIHDYNHVVTLDKLHTTIITTTPSLDGKKINEIGFHPLINHMCIVICDYVVTHLVTFDN
jgi:hypothetical protein